MTKNVFVFPCGSEIALEIARSLKGDFHFHLIGGASVKDHGRFVFQDIEEGIPWVDATDFIPVVAEIVRRRKIDLIYPATDYSLAVLKKAEGVLGCPVVTSSLETVMTCLSKTRMYNLLRDVIRVPKVYSPEAIPAFPVFAKPDIGYGARGTAVLHDRSELEVYASGQTKPVIYCELLTGDEYTVDCFSDCHFRLLYCNARLRDRTMNGISVHTFPAPVPVQKEVREIVETIQSRMAFRGAWFVQLKRDHSGRLTLLEVAARFAGSSGLSRALGVNFAQLSLWDALGAAVSVSPNDFPVEMDRALDNRYKLGITYDKVFLDYDDTVLLSGGRVNPDVMRFVFSCRNRGVKITLISRHLGDLATELETLGIAPLFDRVLHLSKGEPKSAYIDRERAIFIDDSYAERKEVVDHTGVPAFGLDMIDALS